MILSEAPVGTELTVVSAQVDDRTRLRLDALGLVEGERVFVHARSWSGVILQIKGSRLALSRSIAALVEVAAPVPPDAFCEACESQGACAAFSTLRPEGESRPVPDEAEGPDAPAVPSSREGAAADAAGAGEADAPRSRQSDAVPDCADEPKEVR